MTYFTRQWNKEVLLPNGQTASCAKDVDNFLKASNLALSGDYSEEFIKKVRSDKNRALHQKLWAEFLHNYKRSIWYAQK